MRTSQVALSLISHTNAGKTTLARTLLGRDIGEVRDAPHVTLEATCYRLQATPEGDALMLWDTPGFGDSSRLARRLAQQGNPIGWFLTQVWDRFRDEALHLSQKAVRNVRDESDIVLYLVNASETAEDAGYIASELDVLAWIGRPVFVLLNQMGPPQPRHDEEAVERRWRDALRSHALVRGVLPLDAFARCWIQEIVLLRALASAIVPAKRKGFDRLVAAWQARRIAQFEESMEVLAAPIARAACDREALENPGLKDKVRDAIRSIVAKPKVEEDKLHAARQLADRLHAGVRTSTARLIAIHGLEGAAVDTVLERLSGDLRVDAPLHEGKAALLGGVVSGAMSGLAADLAAHGLTFGAGTLIGAIAGALGGAGIARGYNVIRGRTGALLRWDDELLDRLVTAALLRYLAVAHFGRGRGNWKESEYPAFWNEVAQREVDALRPSLSALWSRRDDDGGVSAVEQALIPLLERAARSMLDTLYPGALGKAPTGTDGATTTSGFESV